MGKDSSGLEMPRKCEDKYRGGTERYRSERRWSCGDTTRSEKYGNGNAKRSQEERHVEKEIKMGLYKKINELEEKIERQIAINEAYKKFVDRSDRLLDSINDTLAKIDERVRKLERRDIDDGK